MKLPVSAVIFDMDGTLIDTEPLHMMANRELLSHFGVEYSEGMNQQLIGLRETDCAARLIVLFDLRFSVDQFLVRKKPILDALMRKSAKPRPGALSLIQKLQKRNIPMAIASSSPMPAIELIVDIIGIRQFFQSFTSGEEVPEGKPAPDIFLLASSRLLKQPGECLVIEDSSTGVRAAKSAGMQCLAVPCETTKYQDFSMADAVLDSLEDIQPDDWILNTQA